MTVSTTLPMMLLNNGVDHSEGFQKVQKKGNWLNWIISPCTPPPSRNGLDTIQSRTHLQLQPPGQGAFNAFLDHIAKLLGPSEPLGSIAMHCEVLLQGRHKGQYRRTTLLGPWSGYHLWPRLSSWTQNSLQLGQDSGLRDRGLVVACSVRCFVDWVRGQNSAGKT